jgi:hypothetical protein
VGVGVGVIDDVDVDVDVVGLLASLLAVEVLEAAVVFEVVVVG